MEYYGAPMTYLKVDGKVIDSPTTTKAFNLDEFVEWATAYSERAFNNALQRRAKTTRRPTPPQDEEPPARIKALLNAKPLHRR